ncbi:hypothetical protein Poly51_07220 [Rubripirellula tenax]|uniref:Uncharacterized protein n=1 Tax=Rubripirellula tenax TaxID=2528015 RepID=A0A5C6FF58_9BACT|nr:hypothetical protein [Rubripirellula tenax]TWU60446.1 hypothetical protein Poly51_07220 [Rubripirellula tenax]
MNAPTFYHMYPFRLGYREFIRVAYPHQLLAAVIWPLAKIGIVRWQPTVLPRYPSITDSTIPVDQCPEFAKNDISAAIESGQEQGFVDPMIEHMTSVAGNQMNISGVGVFMRHQSGKYMMSFASSRADDGASAKKVSIITWLANDRLVVTTNGRREFDPSPYAKGTYMTGKSFLEIFAAHQQSFDAQGWTFEPIDSKSALIDACDRVIGLYFDHMTKVRGVMELAPEEVSRGISKELNPYQSPASI